MKICVADDEKGVRESILHKLNTLFPHASVFDVEFGRAALEKIMAVQPDLVFIDIRMPEMDGLEILQALKQMHPSMHAVILSGYEDFEYARRALQLGAIDYLLKPADREQLREVVERVRAELEAVFRREMDIILGKLSDQYIFLQDIRYYNSSLWFDERQTKEFHFGDADCLVRQWESEPEKLLISFTVNSDYGGVLVSTSFEEQRPSFREKQDFLPALLAGMEKWECLRFFEGKRDDGSHLKSSKEGTGQAAQLRNSILSAAKTGDLPALELSLGTWLHVLENKLSFLQLRKECVNLMAMLDEGLTKSEVIVLDEEKIRYWSEWVTKDKTWKELKERIRKFVLGGVRAMLQLEKQTNKSLSWFEQAMKLVETSRDPNLSLESVAEAVGVHPVTLSRIFKQQTGMNFVRFMVRNRLQHSQTLLLKTDKKINDIAEEIGYTDHRYFRSLFKKEFGLTPSEYRRNNGIATPNDEAE
jgi:YesN/AraC family two-component response regulator